MSIITTTTASAQGLTFLQLVQRAKTECGVSGSNPATVQGTLVSDIAKLANWINAAWMDIQMARADWYFMRQDVTFTATPDLGRQYTPAQAGIANVASYKRDSFRCYAQAQGVANQQILPWQSYDSFRNMYLFGSNSLMQERPILFTVDPRKNLMLGPTPNEPYVITGEAFVQPSNLVNDNDLPTMPNQFHMLIVYKAMMYYGGNENAPEVYDAGEMNYRRMLIQLVIDQAPQVTFGGALA